MSQQPFRVVQGPQFKMFSPGKEASSSEFTPGDFILTHGNSIYSKLIRVGQSFRFRGRDRKFARWNHAAMIISTNGDLIEALGAGVRQGNISKYKDTEYHLVQIDSSIANSHDREQSVAFAKWSLNQPYGWLTIFSIAISLMTGSKFTFGFDGQSICSGLVARALERTSAVFNREPSHIMPADLAKYFSIESPPPGTSKGKVPPSPPFRKRMVG